MARDAIDSVIRLFDEFDLTLFSRLENRRLLSLVDNLQVHMKRIGKLTTEIPGRIETSLEQHARVVDALSRRDVEGAQAEMRAHIASVLDSEMAYLEQRPITDMDVAEQM